VVDPGAGDVEVADDLGVPVRENHPRLRLDLDRLAVGVQRAAGSVGVEARVRRRVVAVCGRPGDGDVLSAGASEPGDRPNLRRALVKLALDLRDGGQARLQLLGQSSNKPILGDTERLGLVAQGILGNDLVPALAQQ
jgi:hypothetical protein